MQMLGSKLGAMAKSGIDYAAEIRKLWNNEVNAVIDLTGFYDTEQEWTTARVGSGQLFRYSKAKEIIAPWLKLNASYIFGACPNLVSVTVSDIGNVQYLFGTGGSAGAPNLSDVYVVGRTAETIIRYTSFWTGASNYNPTIVVHASNADIKNIDGTWTIVQRT